MSETAGTYITWLDKLEHERKRDMINREGLPAAGPVTYHLEKVLDAHTHLTGSQSGESSENILECMDACGVEKAFIFAPELDVETRHLTNAHLDDIRAHNDYCADICSAAPSYHRITRTTRREVGESAG